MPSTDRPSPLEALKRNTNAITDAVYGADHPERGKKAKARKGNAPPQKPPAAVQTHGTHVGDVLPQDTRNKLLALQGKLERAESRMNKRKGNS